MHIATCATGATRATSQGEREKDVGATERNGATV
jgi:hypothetical protein